MIARLLIAGLLLLAPALSHAAPELSSLLARLEQAAQKSPAMKGTFTQTSRVKLFKQEMKSEGKFAYAAPNHLRWEYTKPDPSLLEIEGDKATISAPSQPKQVFQLDKDPAMRVVFEQLLAFLSGHVKPSAEYALSTSGSDKAPMLVIEPKADAPAAKVFRRVELTFGGEPLLLQQVLLIEKSGDEKQITLKR